MNQLFAALAQPQTSLSLAHSWHTQSQLDTFLAHHFILAAGMRFLGLGALAQNFNFI